MNYKPILIVNGEPNSIFPEIFFKSIKKNHKSPIILISSLKLKKFHMKKFNFKRNINIIDYKNIQKKILKKNSINLINVDYKFEKKKFKKISENSKKFINKSFKIALNLINSGLTNKLINGPISKKNFLNKKYPGITEYLSKKAFSKNYPVMLIFNKKLSVSPITTHEPIKNVHKNISKKKIIKNVTTINKFYIEKLKKKPLIAILGLNPHCETNSKFSEEEKIIIPSIKNLVKRKIRVDGPFSADTFFFKKNIRKYDVVIGMYHDQVLVPIKTLFNFDAINITLGIPILRISPDHGTNNDMIGLNKSNHTSFVAAIKFMKKINAD